MRRLAAPMLHLFAHSSCAITVFAIASPANAIHTVQNDFYVASVREMADGKPGTLQVRTGQNHLAGDQLDMTFQSTPSNVNIGTSFSGIRVDGDNANAYTQGAQGSVLNDLDTYWSFEEDTPGHDGRGWRTGWDLFQEQLEIIQDVIAVGEDADRSAIYHTVLIRNGRPGPVTIEWMNLYDWSTEQDGGPSATIVRPDGATIVPEQIHESLHAPGSDELVRLQNYQGYPAYEVYLSLSHDLGILPEVDGDLLTTTTPDIHKFVQWDTAWNPSNFGLPFDVFDYEIDKAKDIATNGTGINDSASISMFTATIPQNGEVRLTQVLFVRDAPLSGDFDEDGDVDGDDFLAWQSGFGTTTGATHMDGDADGDGDVDGDDFLIWQGQFGTGEGSGAPGVPEPSGVLLYVVLSLIGILCTARRI